MLTEQFNQTLLSLYEIFTTKDASLIEINPLIVTVENTLLALDGKIDFDKALATLCAVVPPPTSKKLAGEPP
jgi:succinyl-CoA synthetase beta subunit